MGTSDDVLMFRQSLKDGGGAYQRSHARTVFRTVVSRNYPMCLVRFYFNISKEWCLRVDPDQERDFRNFVLAKTLRD